MLNKEFIERLHESIIIFDGAMGTAIQSHSLTADDFSGLDGCNEILNLSRPDIVKRIHMEYLQSGAEAIETNTFGANHVVLNEYGIADKTYAINKAAAQIAKEAVLEFNASEPRFVVGSIGPGTKLPSLGQTTFDALHRSYFEQAKGLIEGGADALIIETCQDMLQCKAAVIAVGSAYSELESALPLIVQVTVETTGVMLLGTDLYSALTTLSPFDHITALGMNCATGPREMTEHLRVLCRHSDKFISVMPNAGLPQLIDGKTHYPLSPEEFADYHRRFVQEFGVNIVGGCCGTTPEHIRKLSEAIKGVKPAERKPQPLLGLSSLYQFQPYKQDTSFFIIGERTNANGSKRFKECLLKSDAEGLLDVAREQASEGAHALDVCIDAVGRDAAADMDAAAFLFNQHIDCPLFIDSDSGGGLVYETALKRLGGKAIINSINFEDGGKKISAVLPLCKKYGAGVVCLTIDENGQPHDVEGKVRIAERLYHAAVNDYGLAAQDLFFDALTFPLGTGESAYRKDAIATFEAIRQIKAKYPNSNTVLGVSNCSFGLKPAARVILNSVFLHYALEAGLDAAIVHAGKIVPLNQIEPKALELARQIIFDERTDSFDPLTKFISMFEAVSEDKPAVEGLRSIEDRLKTAIIKGKKAGIDDLLDEALTKYSALDIVNDILLDGMKTVGDLFAVGDMQLPFVLQSAEAMKAAVAYLEPFMEKSSQSKRGTMVIATVAGDVHDIGKNLVDIILTNNGYRVVNLGIKQSAQAIMDAAERENASAVGMSGLLVKSAVVMRENLMEMNDRHLERFPVILGGAALTRSYVENDLQALYKGNVYYAQDAFDGLNIMEALTNPDGDKSVLEKKTIPSTVKSHRIITEIEPEVSSEKSDIPAAPDIPAPPFWGTRIIEDIPLQEIIPYINETALFRGQWQYKRGSMTNPEFAEYLKETVKPVLTDWLQRVSSMNVFELKTAHGYFPVQSDGNDLIIYHDDMKTERLRFQFPRQTSGKRLCISDFFASKESGIMDIAAFQAVTIGHKASELERSLFEQGQYQDYLYLHGLGVETAEALAEYRHKSIRAELGIDGDDSPEIRLLFSCKYRGCRYSFGYPACPNLEDQALLFDLLNPERIGIELTENYQLTPEQTTTAIICHHPSAKYFNIR